MKTEKKIPKVKISKFSTMKYYLIFTFLLLNLSQVSAQVVKTISSVAELATVASLSDQAVTMQAGVYDLGDYLTPANIDSKTPVDQYDRKAMMRFSGSNNTFDFTGVTINIPTSLLTYIGRGIEFHLTGSNINFKGLTLTCTGNSTPSGPGVTLMTVTGDYITLEDVTLNVAGSSPYGYGDVLGKGGTNLVGMKKHSGMIIEGLDCKFLGCSVYSKAFGHLIAIQGGRNVYFEDCHVEGATRTTDAMLAETSGPAFGVNFASVWPNYDGENVIPPGYTKCLSEDGYRTYGSGATGVNTAGVTLVNCTANKARVGFALEYGGPILIQNCEATGCEGGYNVTDATIENSRGDAVNGPLLYLTGGSNSKIELALMSTLPTTTLHAIATIVGSNHNVTFTKWENQTRTQDHKILLGGTRPTAVNPFSPLGTGSASGITLNNCTGMPIEVYSSVSASTVNSNGTVVNNGSNNTITQKTDCGLINPTCNNTVAKIEAECYDNMIGVVKEPSSEGGENIGSIGNNDWVAYNNVDLTGMNSVQFRIASKSAAGGNIEVRLGSITGTLIGTIPVTSTGDWQTYVTKSVNISRVTGSQNIYLLFKNTASTFVNINWFGFLEDVVCNNTPTRIEAECYTNMSGVVKESSTEDGQNIGSIGNNDWVAYDNLDLTGMNSVQFRIASKSAAGGNIEIRLGSITGTLIGTIPVTSTGDWQTYVTKSVNISSVTGTQNIYLLFKNTASTFVNINWFGFSEERLVVTNLEDADMNDFLSVFPTPCNNNLTVSFNNSSVEGKIQVMNIFGEVLSVKDISGNSEEINLSNEANGLYLIKVITSDQIITREVLKQ